MVIGYFALFERPDGSLAITGFYDNYADETPLDIINQYSQESLVSLRKQVENNGNKYITAYVGTGVDKESVTKVITPLVNKKAAEYNKRKNNSNNSANKDKLIKLAHNKAKEIFGDNYDESKTNNTINGIIKDHPELDIKACLAIFFNGIHGKSKRKRNEESHETSKMNRKLFSEIKKNCKTKSQMKAFNQLIKTLNK